MTALYPIKDKCSIITSLELGASSPGSEEAAYGEWQEGEGTRPICVSGACIDSCWRDAGGVLAADAHVSRVSPALHDGCREACWASSQALGRVAPGAPGGL